MKKAPHPGGGAQGRYYDELPHADEVEASVSARPAGTPLSAWVANGLVVICIVLVVATLGLMR